ncbi:MAG: ABC transporter permease, partial [Actinobacteria bacterium]|nr:ABC transporter permease [Actinomycetota bacterium]
RRGHAERVIRMAAYILRRLGAGILVLVVGLFFLYILVSLSGNPLANLLSNPRISPATINAARIELHLNEPLLSRYWTWVTGLLHGNFGTSTLGQPVAQQIWPRMWVTLQLVIPAVIISVLLGIGLGVTSAVRQYSVLDHVSTAFAYFFFATPVFVVGILLKDFLAVKLDNAVGHTVLYTVGQNSPGTTGVWSIFTDALAHSVLPILTLVLITYASWSRYQRASMLDVLNADYVRLARAKGLARRRVLYVHALRNAMIPVTTIIAVDFATILGGTLITEIVFGWEGMGRWLYEALVGPVTPDVNVVMAYLVVVATLFVIFNLIADILYGVLDPRIRLA